MTVEQGIGFAISFVKVLFAVVAIVIGGMTIWKLSLSGFNVDPKAGAEIAACFAASYFFLK